MVMGGRETKEQIAEEQNEILSTSIGRNNYNIFYVIWLQSENTISPNSQAC